MQQAKKFAEKVSVSARFHGEVFIGTREFSTITAAVEAAFIAGVENQKNMAKEHLGELRAQTARVLAGDQPRNGLLMSFARFVLDKVNVLEG